jgi:hypothetical protein
MLFIYLLIHNARNLYVMAFLGMLEQYKNLVLVYLLSSFLSLHAASCVNLD